MYELSRHAGRRRDDRTATPPILWKPYVYINKGASSRRLRPEVGRNVELM